jgi:Mannosyltransferase (PIG-V)
MSPDTAEMAIVDTEPVRSGSFGAPAAAPGRGPMRAGRTPVWGWGARLRADPARMTAVRETWRALWVSRLLVWVAGAGTVATLGFGPVRNAFNPPGVTRGFGWLGDLLAAPAARWDSAWYLVIAHYGYRPELGSYTSARDAFFPLYPLGLRALSDIGLQAVLAGVLFSLAAFALALYGIHRLSTLELGSSVRPGGDDVARLAVLVTALAPMAFYFSAVYSESLYLALSVGLFWCARQGRWAWVGVLGALATATRSTGLVLVLPALMLYLYGPREDRPPDFAFAQPPRVRGDEQAADRRSRAGGGDRTHVLAALSVLARRLRPRYRLRASVMWLALLPAGMGLYVAYLGLHGGDPLAPFHAQDVWGRHFAGPYLGVWDGVRAAFEGARQLLSGQRTHVYFALAGGSPFVSAGHNLMLLAFLLAAVLLFVLALRVLPLAYGVYVLAALALPLSYPVPAQPLMSLPRFLVVLFPLSMALAAWLATRPRARMPVLAVSALLMAFFVAQFATWHWVA